jgi:type II secretory pathway pseudopilin PulG
MNLDVVPPFTTNKNNQMGQTLVEVIVVIGIVIIMITVVVQTSLNSVKTTTFTEYKSQATAYAKEGIELARAQRDAGWYAFATRGNSTGVTWCVDGNGTWTQAVTCSSKIDGVFDRIITLTYNSAAQQMTVVSRVTWLEGGNTRQSEVTTLLSNWR